MSERRPNPLVQLSLARWRSFYREPGVLFWTVGFPILLSIVLGVAFRNQREAKVPVAIPPCADRDGLARELTAAGLEVLRLDEEGTHQALRSGRVALTVARDAAAGQVRFSFDPSRPEARLARSLAKDALERARGRADLTTIEDHPVTEAGGRYIDFLIPGLIGLNLLNGGLWGIGYVVVDLRTRKLLRRLAATPMRRPHFLFSFGILRSLLICLELPLLALFAAIAFDVPFRGSVFAFATTAVVGAMCFAAFGLLIASRAQNNQTVSGLINLVSLPMMLGSGVFFSSERFPHAVRVVVACLPLTALNDALRAIMLDGVSLFALGRPLAILLAYTVLAFLSAMALFRWR